MRADDDSRLPENRNLKYLICNAGAGAAAGAIAATFVCPLDVLKTRLQVYGLPKTTRSCKKGGVIITGLRDIVRAEGFLGMYRGLSPTILALLPNWAVYFTVYEQLKRLLMSHGNDNSKHQQVTLKGNVLAASVAGAATAITTNPLWVVKTRLQTQGMRQGVIPYKGVYSALRRIAQEEGVRGFYSGLLPSLAGITHVAIQFPVYESIKSYLAKMGDTREDKLSPGNVALASSASKILASVLTYPHEVVRSRLQEQGQGGGKKVYYSGVADCVRVVLWTEGVSGFYRGCATNLLRTTPSAAITFTSYEMLHRLLLRVMSPPSGHPSLETRPIH